MRTRPMKVRVYKTQVDDLGKEMWLAEAGEPISGGGWAIFADIDCAEETREKAVAALRDLLTRRMAKTRAALSALEGLR